MRESRVKDGGMSIIMRIWTILSLSALLTRALKLLDSNYSKPLSTTRILDDEWLVVFYFWSNWWRRKELRYFYSHV